MAALFRLGMAGTDPRVLPWVSYIPTLGLLYGVARLSGVGRRGALLACVIGPLSSSASKVGGLWETDLLAVGPASARGPSCRSCGTGTRRRHRRRVVRRIAHRLRACSPAQLPDRFPAGDYGASALARSRCRHKGARRPRVGPVVSSHGNTTGGGLSGGGRSPFAEERADPQIGVPPR